MSPRVVELLLELGLVVGAAPHLAGRSGRCHQDDDVEDRDQVQERPRDRGADHAGRRVQGRAVVLAPGRSSARTPTDSRNASPNTIVEWPSENQNPTLSGRLPSPIILRVVLSIAAMWSASKACRIPSVYAVMSNTYSYEVDEEHHQLLARRDRRPAAAADADRGLLPQRVVRPVRSLPRRHGAPAGVARPARLGKTIGGVERELARDRRGRRSACATRRSAVSARRRRARSSRRSGGSEVFSVTTSDLLLAPKRMIELEIDGAPVRVFEGETILGACRRLGIDTPTLCYGDTLEPANACRVCVVEVEGARVLAPACSRKAEEGMKVQTDSERVRHSRQARARAARAPRSTSRRRDVAPATSSATTPSPSGSARRRRPTRTATASAPAITSSPTGRPRRRCTRR